MQDNLDNITLNSIPLAEALPEARDKRIIKVRNKAIQVMQKGIEGARPVKKAPWRQHQRMRTKDFKPGKGRYLTKKQIEEEIMERDIKKINTEGLTGAECIYMAFKEMDWKGLRTPEVAFATGKSYGSISALLSGMQKNGMLVREEKEPKKFYYKVAEDCQGLGRVGWANMFKEVQNAVRKKGKSNRVVKKKGKSVSTPVVTSSEVEIDTQLADVIHRLVDKLNLALKNAMMRGLGVRLQVLDTHYEGFEGPAIVLDHKVYREF